MKDLLRKLRAAFRTKSWRAGAYSVFAAILVIAIAVVANLAVSALPATATQLDMTKEQLYSISPGTEQILAGLTQDVDVYWLVRPGSEDSTVEQVLGKYAEYSHVTVTRVDPVRYPSFAVSYTDEQVTNNSLIVAAGDRSVYIPFSDIWTYSDYEEYSYYLYTFGEEYRDVFAGEGVITGAIRYVTGDELSLMYILTGHGETTLSDGVLNAVVLENVQTETLNLVSAGAVPTDCDTLAIFGPVSDLSGEELDAIRDYTAGGGKVLITTAYTVEAMPNFRALLADFGLELTNGCVLESDSRYYNYGYIDLVLPTLGSHDITTPLGEGGYTVMMPDAQALTKTQVEDVAVTALLTSSQSSYIKEDLEGLASYDRTEGDAVGPFILGAAAENNVTGAKAAVFTSTGFMEPDYSDVVSGANEDLFLNAVDWLCELDDAISIHPKVISGDYLAFTDSVAGVLKVALVAVIPVLFLAAGVAIFIGRRRR